MRLNSTLSTLFGVALLAAIGYTLWYLARWGLGFWDETDTPFQIGAAAAVTLFVCAAMIANGLHAVARRDEVRQQREARAAVYEQVLRLRGPRGGPALLTHDEQGAEQLMLLHASPAVLRAYLRLRGAPEATGADAGEDAMVDLIQAMRRDLGQRGTDVKAGELAGLLAPAVRPRVRVGTGDVMHG
ncbi:MAG TPA: hypothetical protein VGB24_04455 [Longimicrobium sp.]|jgi:hypothetical protein|uniref:hypothetical protein n=1 Tax=Longimicrobium sp. TaxID=2029185 RepID=UPI002EDAC45E